MPVNEELNRFGERVLVALLGVAPLRAYTRGVRLAADLRLPRSLRRPLLGWVADRLGMDLAEAEQSLEEYSSLGELFVRRLRPGSRPIDRSDELVISPVDGCVSSFGTVGEGRLLQAKGIDYSLRELVADDALARQLEGGAFITLYLRPKDYHRIHCPVAGDVVASRTIAGMLMPVQPVVVRNLKGLFARNERLVVELDSVVGKMAMVCVGATAVGSITTVFDAGQGFQRYDPPLPMAKGAEIAAFNMGSTVILIFQRGRVMLSPLQEMQEIRVGQTLGRRRAASSKVA